MTPSLYDKVCDLFENAIKLEPPERFAFLERECGQKTPLRAAVQKFLDGYEQEEKEGSLLAMPMEHSIAAIVPAKIADSRIGQRLGPYEIKDELGEGGMGSVFLAARTDDFEKQAVVKLIRAGKENKEFVRRFRNERQVLARLDHANIARLLDGGETDEGLPYLVMEHIAGVPLDNYCQKFKPDVRKRLELFLEICAAVQYAHQRMVIHRDLKPDNILVDADERPHVLDFGIARITDRDLKSTTFETETGRILGTLPYMSPEQVSGNPDEVDIRSDVYALGVICFEILGERLPLDMREKQVAECVRIIAEQEPIHLGTVKPELKGDLELIVKKAMAKEKPQRYQSVSEFAADIERCLNDEPILARPPSVLYQLRKFTKRNKILVGAAAAVVLSLLLGLAGTVWWASEAIEQGRRAVVAERDKFKLLDEFYANVGDTAMRRGEWRLAINTFQKLAKQGRSDDVACHLKIVQARFALNELDEANKVVQALAKEIDLGKHEGSVLLLQAEMALGRDDKQAEQIVKQALNKELSPAESAYAHGLIAKTTSKSIERLREALRHDPNYYQARHVLALLLLLHGDTREAQQRIQRIQTSYPDDPNGYMLEAMDLALRGEKAKTSRLLEKMKRQWGKDEIASAELVIEMLDTIQVGAKISPEEVLKLRFWVLRAGNVFARIGNHFGALQKKIFLPVSLRPPPVLIRSLGKLPEVIRQIPRTDKAEWINIELIKAAAMHDDGFFHYLRSVILFSVIPNDSKKAEQPRRRVLAAMIQAAETQSCLDYHNNANFYAAFFEGYLAYKNMPPFQNSRMQKHIRKRLNNDAPLTPNHAKFLAKVAWKAEAPDLARRALFRWHDNYPDSIDALRTRAEIELKAESYVTAMEYAKKVLNKIPDDKKVKEYYEQALNSIRTILKTESQKKPAEISPRN